MMEITKDFGNAIVCSLPKKTSNEHINSQGEKNKNHSEIFKSPTQQSVKGISKKLKD